MHTRHRTLARNTVPDLIIGPLLRYVGPTDATVWVETDAACEVEVLGCPSPTFRVGDHHYALVHVTDLEPGEACEYEVRLDDRVVWPEPGSPFPPSVIRPMKNGEDLRLVFGSCRISAPHEPPYTLGHDENGRGLGVDALEFEGRHATITYEKAVLDSSNEPALKRLYQCRLA